MLVVQRWRQARRQIAQGQQVRFVVVSRRDGRRRRGRGLGSARVNASLGLDLRRGLLRSRRQPFRERIGDVRGPMPAAALFTRRSPDGYSAGL